MDKKKRQRPQIGQTAERPSSSSAILGRRSGSVSPTNSRATTGSVSAARKKSHQDSKVLPADSETTESKEETEAPTDGAVNDADSHIVNEEKAHQSSDVCIQADEAEIDLAEETRAAAAAAAAAATATSATGAIESLSESSGAVEEAARPTHADATAQFPSLPPSRRASEDNGEKSARKNEFATESCGDEAAASSPRESPRSSRPPSSTHGESKFTGETPKPLSEASSEALSTPRPDDSDHVLKADSKQPRTPRADSQQPKTPRRTENPAGSASFRAADPVVNVAFDVVSSLVSDVLSNVVSDVDSPATGGKALMMTNPVVATSSAWDEKSFKTSTAMSRTESFKKSSTMSFKTINPMVAPGSSLEVVGKCPVNTHKLPVPAGPTSCETPPVSKGLNPPSPSPVASQASFSFSKTQATPAEQNVRQGENGSPPWTGIPLQSVCSSYDSDSDDTEYGDQESCSTPCEKKPLSIGPTLIRLDEQSTQAVVERILVALEHRGISNSQQQSKGNKPLGPALSEDPLPLLSNGLMRGVSNSELFDAEKSHVPDVSTALRDLAKTQRRRSSTANMPYEKHDRMRRKSLSMSVPENVAQEPGTSMELSSSIGEKKSSSSQDEAGQVRSVQGDPGDSSLLETMKSKARKFLPRMTTLTLLGKGSEAKIAVAPYPSVGDSSSGEFNELRGELDEIREMQAMKVKQQHERYLAKQGLAGETGYGSGAPSILGLNNDDQRKGQNIQAVYQNGYEDDDDDDGGGDATLSGGLLSRKGVIGRRISQVMSRMSMSATPSPKSIPDDASSSSKNGIGFRLRHRGSIVNHLFNSNLPQLMPDDPPDVREEKLKKLYPELWNSFKRYDRDGSGQIDSSELITYVQIELGSEVNDEDIRKFFTEMDEDNDGGVSFRELGEWYHTVVSSLDLGKDANGVKTVTVGNLFDFARFQVHDVGKQLKKMAAPSKRPSIVDAYDDIEYMDMSHRWIIHPMSSFHITWDLAVSGILLITVITLPLTMAFEEFNGSLYSFNLCVDIVFMLDICKNFFTGYVDSDGVVRLAPKSILKHYLAGWFIPDLLSSIPLDQILALVSGEDSTHSADPLARSAKTLKLVRLIRMTKLFRLLRVGRAAKYILYYRRLLEERLKIRISDSTIRMGKLAIMLMVVSHWVGCVQFLIVRIMDFPPHSWASITGLDKMSVGLQYSWSLYKALLQMIGQGYQIAPVTNLSCEDVHDEWCALEMWITLICMYIGSLFYAIMISNISSIIFSMNFASRLYQEKAQQLNEYMRSKNLPPILRDKVREYYSLRYTEGKIFNEDAIMNDLSPALRREIMIYTSRELFLKVPFFRESGNGFISSLATRLVPMVAFQGDVIVEEGTTGENMFFISSGKVQIYIEEVASGSGESPKSRERRQRQEEQANALDPLDQSTAHSSKVIHIASLAEGCFFGEVALLLPVRRTASARAQTVAMLHVLDRECLLTSLKDFPEIQQRLTEIATSRVKRITRRLKSDGQNQADINAFVLDRDLQDISASTLSKKLRLEARQRGGVRVNAD